MSSAAACPLHHKPTRLAGFEEEQQSDAAMSSPAASTSTSQNGDHSENGDPRSRLEQLKSHPFFNNLQLTLALDCLQSNVPYSLLSESTSSGKSKSAPAFSTVSDNLMELDLNIQKLLVSVQMYFPSLLATYRQLVDNLESQRYKALTYNCHSDNLKGLINWFYDCERRNLIQSTQEQVTALMTKAKNILPESSALAFGLTSNFYGFPLAAAAKAPLTLPKNPEVESPLDLSGAHDRIFSKTQSPQKKSRFLSKKAVAILQHWYHSHKDHPYATDEEVKELAAAGCITPNQVKKWMANTRARTYNTLPYNGGKHMLNSKIAMKKRLLHKYKLDPRHLLTNSSSAGGSLSQGRPVVDPSVPSPGASDNADEEPIDVETVSSSQTPDIVEAQPAADGDVAGGCGKDDKQQSPTLQKASLEQVIARCRLKSAEIPADESPTHKSVIESLRDVVNNVSSTIDVATEEPQPLLTEASPSSSQAQFGVKRYLSPQARTVLSEWFRKHLYRPYPTFEEKRELAAQCGISTSKVDTWFANKRNRTNNTKRFPPKYSHVF